MRFLQRPRKKLAGGKAAGMNQIQVLSLFTPSGRGSTAGPPLEQISGLTLEGTAQFAQHVCAVHPSSVMGECMQCWVADAGFPLQSQDRPSPPSKKLSEPANNLGVGHAVRLAQPAHWCKLYFTTVECRAILGSVSRRSIHQSCLIWDSCARIEKRASQALGTVVCAPVRVVPLGGIAVPAAACGLWRTSWAVKIGAGRHGGVYCGPGGGLRVG